jgi:uncharacterized protein (TIGR02996 family)
MMNGRHFSESVMSDRDALFQAILDAPDDDAPRLVFADWLDEQGESDRAEFIRVQCEMARLPFYEPRYVHLERRAAELHVRCITEWRFHWLPPEQEFRRGFVEELTLPGGMFLRRADDLFRQTPLRWVHFTGLPQGRPWRWEPVARLSGVEFPVAPFGQPDEWLGLVLPRLRWLKVGLLTAATAFLRAAACPRLEALDLSGSPVANADLDELLQEVCQTTVRAFALDAAADGNYADRLRATGARMLATFPLDGLVQLHLRGQLIGDAGLFHLARSPHLDRLEELYLDRNEIGLIGPTGIEDLCSSATLPRLRVLSLAGNPVGAAGVRELAGWPGLGRLRWLDLSKCDLSTAAVRPLADSPYRHDGLNLRLAGNAFDPDDLFPARALRPAAGSVS